MNAYQKSIIEATGCPEADAPLLEEIMRHTIFHSTLDWLSKEAFDKGARDAYDVHLYEIGLDNPDQLKRFAMIMRMQIKDTEQLLDEICGDNIRWKMWGKFTREHKLSVKDKTFEKI